MKAFHLAALAAVGLLFGVSCRQTSPIGTTVPSAALAQEQIDAFGASPVRAHRLLVGVGSGSKDWDRDGTPDGLELLVRLVDREDLPAKRPGALHFRVYAYDFATLSHRGALLGRWAAPASKAIELWEAGLHPGYRVKLKWRASCPKTRLVMLDIDFLDTDGGRLRLEGALVSLPE